MARISEKEFDRRKSWTLDEKIQASACKIEQWYNHHGGKVCVSFSGGMDSTVLLHLVRNNPAGLAFPDVPAVFADTGLEYPEIREHVKNTPGVKWVRPKMNFIEVLRVYGYPVISKRNAQYIHEVRSAKGETATKRLRLTGINTAGRRSEMSMISKKWQYLCSAPFKISGKCCDIMKKNPAKLAQKEYGAPFIGTRADEASQRKQTYLSFGCNAYEIKTPRSTPLAFWSDADIWEYVRRFGVPYSKIYDMGYTRTGCMFCMFGVHLEKEPNRFQLMYKTHPKAWKYCMDKLGLREVLRHCGIPSEPSGQMDLFNL